MLTLLHGDNIVKSRELLNKHIKKAKEAGIKDIIRLNGRKLEPAELLQATESQSLFGGDRLVVVEEIHKNRSKTIKKELASILSDLDPNTDHLILWESKSLTKTQLKKLSNFNQDEFKTSAVIFKLTDSLQSQNLKQKLELLRQSVDQESEGFVLYMLARQIRLLLQCAGGKPSGAPWMVKKLKSQFKSLGEEKVLAMHESLVDIDWKSKTGGSPFNVVEELELFLVKHHE